MSVQYGAATIIIVEFRRAYIALEIFRFMVAELGVLRILEVQDVACLLAPTPSGANPVYWLKSSQVSGGVTQLLGEFQPQLLSLSDSVVRLR